MKLKFLLLILMAGGITALPLAAQEHSDKTERSISLANTADNELLIKNINGSVTVEGYAGNTIQLEAVRRIKAKNEERLQEGVADVTLGIKEEGNTVVVYIDAPFATLKKSNSGRWNYHVHQEGNRYQYEFDIRLKVPDGLTLDVSTVNGGSVSVQNVSGPLEARNVNGEVSLSNVSGSSSAKTVNGLITANLRSVPEAEVEYETVNGDIKVFFPAALAADIDFDTMNGDFYTDFDDISRKPNTMESTTGRSGKGKVYRIDKSARLSVNGGGNPIRFKTLNGDIYLQKQN